MKRNPLLRLLPLLLVALCVGLLYVGFRVVAHPPHGHRGWFGMAYGQTRNKPAKAERNIAAEGEALFDNFAEGEPVSEIPAAASEADLNATRPNRTASAHPDHEMADTAAEMGMADMGMEAPPPRQVMLEVMLMEIDYRVLQEKKFDLAKEIRAEPETGANRFTSPTPPAETVAVLDPREVRLLQRSIALAGAGKVVAEPRLITVSGRVGRFHAGGEIPLLVVEQTVNGTRQETISTRSFGNLVQVTPNFLDKNRLRLEVEGEYSRKLSDKDRLPRILVRKVRATAVLKLGQALVIAETPIEAEPVPRDAPEPEGGASLQEQEASGPPPPLHGLLLILVPRDAGAVEEGMMGGAGGAFDTGDMMGAAPSLPRPARPVPAPAVGGLLRRGRRPVIAEPEVPSPVGPAGGGRMEGANPSANLPHVVHLQLDAGQVKHAPGVKPGDRVKVIAIRRLGAEPGPTAEVFEDVLKEVVVQGTARIEGPGRGGTTIDITFLLPPKAAERLDLAQANCQLDVVRLPMEGPTLGMGPGLFGGEGGPPDSRGGPMGGPMAAGPHPPGTPGMPPGGIEPLGPAARPAPLRDELHSLREEVRGLRHDIDRVIELLEKRQSKPAGGPYLPDLELGRDAPDPGPGADPDLGLDSPDAGPGAPGSGLAPAPGLGAPDSRLGSGAIPGLAPEDSSFGGADPLDAGDGAVPAAPAAGGARDPFGSGAPAAGEAPQSR